MQSENRVQRPIVTKLGQNGYKINLNNVPIQNKYLFWICILNTKYKMVKRFKICKIQNTKYKHIPNKKCSSLYYK